LAFVEVVLHGFLGLTTQAMLNPACGRLSLKCRNAKSALFRGADYFRRTILFERKPKHVEIPSFRIPEFVRRGEKRIIRTLVRRGADTSCAMDCAQRGLAGAYEGDTIYDHEKQAETPLDREGYREIIELLRELGIG
jgi:hypothetical protein